MDSCRRGLGGGVGKEAGATEFGGPRPGGLGDLPLFQPLDPPVQRSHQQFPGVVLADRHEGAARPRDGHRIAQGIGPGIVVHRPEQPGHITAVNIVPGQVRQRFPPVKNAPDHRPHLGVRVFNPGRCVRQGGTGQGIGRPERMTALEGRPSRVAPPENPVH